MKLTLLRHTAVDVPPGTCYGQTDVPLKDTFPAEAEIVRRRLEGRKFDAVFTSPLTRCTLLAAACGYPEAERDSRLMELNFGEWEMKRWDEITDPRLYEWYEDYLTVRPTGGESFEDQSLRLRDFISDLTSRLAGDSEVAIFTHGGIIIQFMLLLSGTLTPAEAFAAQPPYGHSVELTLPSLGREMVSTTVET